jgi:hypothetical protein
LLGGSVMIKCLYRQLTEELAISQYRVVDVRGYLAVTIRSESVSIVLLCMSVRCGWYYHRDSFRVCDWDWLLGAFFACEWH